MPHFLPDGLCLHNDNESAYLNVTGSLNVIGSILCLYIYLIYPLIYTSPETLDL